MVGTPKRSVGALNCWFYVAANPTCVSLSPNTATAAFASPAQYTYGNSGRNILRADGLKQLDFTILKQFPVTESKSFEFQAEMVNIANHPIFAAPSKAINSSSGWADQLDAEHLQGIIQLALKFLSSGNVI